MTGRHPRMQLARADLAASLGNGLDGPAERSAEQVCQNNADCEGYKG